MLPITYLDGDVPHPAPPPPDGDEVPPEHVLERVALVGHRLRLVEQTEPVLEVLVRILERLRVARQALDAREEGAEHAHGGGYGKGVKIQI